MGFLAGVTPVVLNLIFGKKKDEQSVEKKNVSPSTFATEGGSTRNGAGAMVNTI